MASNRLSPREKRVESSVRRQYKGEKRGGDGVQLACFFCFVFFLCELFINQYTRTAGQIAFVL